MDRRTYNKLVKRKEFWVISLFTLLCVLMGTYVYLLSLSVVDVVMHKETKKLIVEVNSQISHLETSYIASQHDLSAQLANMDGYVESTQKVFLRKSAHESLVLRDQ